LDADAPVPVILAVDVEPDGRLLDPARPLPWRGYEALHAYLSALRPRIAQATGSPVHYSWFFRMDPQIADVYGSPDWAARRYDSAVCAASAEGDEFGLHQHAFRWNTTSANWVCDHGNQAWVEHCVKMGFTAFAGHFARPCPSFRFGDRWMNNETLHLVERLGARADLTLEPGMPAVRALVAHESHTGWLPDYSEVPHGIYRPRRDDYRRRDSRRADGIWMVPVTTGSVPPRGGALKRALLRLGRAGAGRPHVTSLNLAVSPPTFARLVAQGLARGESTHLAMVVRVDAAVRPKYRAHMEANLDAFLRHAERTRFVFSTVQEAIAETAAARPVS
jgi:hypothetical protein